jgi:hypothetical protein
MGLRIEGAYCDRIYHIHHISTMMRDDLTFFWPMSTIFCSTGALAFKSSVWQGAWAGQMR